LFASATGRFCKNCSSHEQHVNIALGAQELVELRSELAGVAHSAVQVSGQLFNASEADQPDVLEATGAALRRVWKK
jgi:hypothetical protein